MQYTYTKSSTGYCISAYHEYAAGDIGAAQTTGAKVQSGGSEATEYTYDASAASKKSWRTEAQRAVIPSPTVTADGWTC